MMATGVAAQLQKAFQDCRDMDGPINERLATYKRAMMAINPDFAGGIERLIARLKSHDCGTGAPGIGDTMPDFALPDEHGRIIRLEELLARGPTAVMFHRGHWCPFCRINLAAVARHGDTIAAAGGHLVVITPETQDYNARFKSEARAHFPVLTDLDNGFALSLNLAIWVGQELKAMMAERGRLLPDSHGNDAWMLPIPATFVVGRDGRIVGRFVDPDFRTRMDLDQLIEAMKRG